MNEEIQSKTKRLENIKYLIGYWIHSDDNVIMELLKPECDIFKDFVTPFAKELNRNLFDKETLEVKESVIKHYIFEFFEVKPLFRNNDEILTNNRLFNYHPNMYEYTNDNGIVIKLNDYQIYVVSSGLLYNALFNEIQICCLKYKLDFFKICDDLNFPLDYIDSSISIDAEDYCDSNEEDMGTNLNKSSKPSLSQIALIHVYTGKLITKENSGEIAKKYGWQSGHKLYQLYNYYYKTSNRKGRPNNCTQKKLENKIELIVNVIDRLPEDTKPMAQDDLATLKTLLDDSNY